LTKKEIEKERKKEEIIKAAEDLFFTDSFDGTSMDVIAKNSEFSKRTLYKYFVSKEELFSAIAYRGLVLLRGIVDNSLKDNNKVYDSMLDISKNLINLHKNNKNYAKAICGLLTIISKSNSGRGEYLTKCINEFYEIFNCLKTLLEKGIKEGSIKKDIDIPKTIYSIQMIFAGIYSINKNVFNFVVKKDYDFSFDEIFEYNFNLIIMAIKN
jgi:AcrR family transcriptional regulator